MFGSSLHKKALPRMHTRAEIGPAAQVSHRLSKRITSPGRHLSIIRSSMVWTLGTRTLVRTSSSRLFRSSTAHFHHMPTGIAETAAPAAIFFRTRTRLGVNAPLRRLERDGDVIVPEIAIESYQKTDRVSGRCFGRRLDADGAMTCQCFDSQDHSNATYRLPLVSGTRSARR